jgi:hypothetical protein
MAAPVNETDGLKLVDVAQLQALVDGAAHLDPTQKEYLRKRWLHQVRWWDRRAWEARQRYFSFRVIIVLGGILVPFLTITSLGAQLDPLLRLAAAVVSLLVAACAGLEALYGWGGIWLEKRRAAELLKVEGWLFLHGAGVYKGRPAAEAFPDFVTEVESQIAAEVGEYVAVAQSARTQPPTSGPSGQAPTAQVA